MELTQGHTAYKQHDMDLNTCSWTLYSAFCYTTVSVVSYRDISDNLVVPDLQSIQPACSNTFIYYISNKSWLLIPCMCQTLF